MGQFRPKEGDFDAGAVRIAVIAARWNSKITDALLDGAIKALARHGIIDKAVDVFRVPGAFELPIASQHAARTERYNGIIALGCVIRGDTPHFDYVCSETTRGLGQVSLKHNMPIAFGLLTTDNLDQALARAGNNAENKGEESALSILEMLTVFNQMDGSW
ncbi:MAG: 6,7-dimethyl-8-ribityllumazine synthase [Porticoccaceae bacterium]|nr:6,7-dimethyl-8-ribityllumazine synthase [Porticoccaceae bacterium]MDG1474016.1 6,7-dimethyl-8-ribityllumazine synthase [Porticoccaceae bacterium]